MIEREAGGPPPLPAGQSIVGYLAPNAAQLQLPGGKHAVVESTQPMATENSAGQLAPVNLGLSAAGEAFESARPVVGAIIPKHLSAGVELPERGVSLTPTDAGGTPLEADGTLQGASIIYANTQTDTDTAVKPTTEGIDESTILRSVASPTQLHFRVGLPPGASLVQADGASSARVVLDGQTIATVNPPGATDAEGREVPVSMSAVRDLLTLTVSTKGGEYRWPIAVDPELASVTDHFFGPSECYKEGEAERKSSNWCVHVSQESKFGHHWSTTALEQWNQGGPINAGDYTVAAYHTQGESKIYKVEVETAGHVTKGTAKLELARKRSTEAGEVEQSKEIATNASWGLTKTSLCANAECSRLGGSAENLAAFKLEANEPLSETYSLDATLQNAYVYIEQENAPTVTFDETDATLSNGRTNALFGGKYTGSTAPWLGPYSNTAFEFKAHDPGIGVSWGQIVVGGFRQLEPLFGEGKCRGSSASRTTPRSSATTRPCRTAKKA
jgi:hypothetical protein